MREQVIQIVEQYIDAVRHNDADSSLLLGCLASQLPTTSLRRDQKSSHR